MNAMRRFSYAVFGVACTHLVFGAIVRISGSGMGCGPHWPKCYGYWFPPFSRPDLIIEVLHRYLASVLLLSLIALVVAAYRRRMEPGVGGPRGVLRMALLATALGFGAALLGAVTVKLGNSAPATVAHWTVAMSLVAAVTATVIRAGGLGGASALLGGASARTRRGTLVAAGLALAAVVMGGLTAKVQGGPVACLAFPLCGANPAVARGAVHVQSTHRVIAVLLVLHLVGLFFALRKRGEAPVIRRAATIALGFGVLQLLVAGAMIGMHLPPVLRSLHEAVGVSIWIATFVLAHLARIASDDSSSARTLGRSPVSPAAPVDLAPTAAASARVAGTTPRQALARAIAAPETLATAGVANVWRDTADGAYQPVGSTTSSGSMGAALAAEPALASVPAWASAEEPVELQAALERATRGAAGSTLAFHEVAAGVAASAATEWDAAAATAVAVGEPGERAVPEPAPATAAAGDGGSGVKVAEADVIEPLRAAEAPVGTRGGPPGEEVIGIDREHRHRSPVAIIDRTLSDRTLLAETLLAESRMAVARGDELASAVTAGDASVVGARAIELTDAAHAGVVDVAVAATVADASVAGAAIIEPAAAGTIVVSTAVVSAAVVETLHADTAAHTTAFGPADADMADADAAGIEVLDAGIADIDALDLARGAPPEREGTAEAPDDADHPDARVTIFDARQDTEDDGLYNLRGLDDEDEDEGDGPGEHVPTLDEEFSLRASGLHEDDEDDRADAAERVSAMEEAARFDAPPVVAPLVTPFSTLSSIAALRRPAMSHSVAVIVARGADL